MIHFIRRRSLCNKMLVLLGTLLCAGTVWAASAQELPLLAEQGRFEQVLTALKSQDVAKTDNENTTQELIKDLERHVAFEAELNLQRAQQYADALANVESQLRDGLIDDAMSSAVEAHTLESTPGAVVADPRVQKMVAAAEEAATQARENGDWIEALNLYRSLDVLFDDHATYHKDVSRLQRRVRMLRMYAPQEFARLYKLHAQRQGDEEAVAELPDESWQDVLDGANATMLKQALDYASGKHVEGVGYAQMLDGAVESLQVLLDTPEMEKTFPTLADARKLKVFRRTLDDVRASSQRRPNLGITDAGREIDRIFAMNDRSLKLPKQVLSYEMADGAMERLDPFSAVIWPTEKEGFSRNTRGKFYGVGIQIGRTNNELTVVTPIPNTPAHRAKIRPGDVIAKVNGQDTAGWSLEKAVREITGPENTDVVLGIRRKGVKQIMPFRLIRMEIPIESIRGWDLDQKGGWEYYIDRDDKIGYVRMSQFIPQTADDLDAAITAMQEDAGLNGLILDLRFNPGGLLSAAVDVSDRFIKEGPIVSTVNANGMNTHLPLRARPERTYRDFPVVVLINQGSASASEIVAGALQAYGRATIVGTRSFGKGSVQDLFGLDGKKAMLKLTTQYYALPNGRIIHRKPNSKTWGIEPELHVPMSAEQLEKAMEYRQKIDIVHADDEPLPVGEEPAVASEILNQNMDPQLSTALLVLKTRLVSQRMLLVSSKK